MQVEKRSAEHRIPSKKCRVLITKIKSSEKWDFSAICESKNSTRRSKRLAKKAEKKQKIKHSSETGLYCSAIVSQPSKRKKSKNYQNCLKAEAHKLRRVQNLRSSSNISNSKRIEFKLNEIVKDKKKEIQETIS